MTPRQQWQLAYRHYRSLQWRGAPQRSFKIPGRMLMACNYAYLSRGDKLADRRPGHMLKSRQPMRLPHSTFGPSTMAQWNCRCSYKPL